MKKLLLSFVLVTGLLTASFAQTAPATASKKETKTTQPAPAHAAATSPSPAPAHTAAASPAPAKAATAPVKRDGTPDMRYKTNKENAAPVTHTKKDGTPDKRYTENKKN